MEARASQGKQGQAGEIWVLGIGHLAAALRRELLRLGFQGESAQQSAALIVACSDFENPAAFAEIAHRAAQDRLPVIFAWLEEEGGGESAASVVDRACFFMKSGGR